jgi:hypothetical protein
MHTAAGHPAAERMAGTVLERQAFEAMRRQFNILRGRDPEIGLPQKVLLDHLEMSDVAAALVNQNFIGS